MMNTHMLKFFVAAMMALLLSGCAVFGGQQTAGEYVDDATITTRVKARFVEDEKVNALRLGVETMGGTVQLSGFATSSAERQRAGEIARGVPGVRGVRNDVVVRPGKN
jgi:hyperosmotically inducible periplasmic protein